MIRLNVLFLLFLSGFSLHAQTRTVDDATDIVTIEVPRQSNYYVIVENVPFGTFPVEISDDGVFDPTAGSARGSVKWGPFDGARTISVSYRLIGNARSPVFLSGVAGVSPFGFNMGPLPEIEGDAQIQIDSDPYATWASFSFPDPNSIEAESFRDPDRDALPNFAERMLRSAPLMPNLSPLELELPGDGTIRLRTDIQEGSAENVSIERLDLSADAQSSGVELPASVSSGEFNGQEILEASEPIRETGIYRLRIEPESSQ